MYNFQEIAEELSFRIKGDINFKDNNQLSELVAMMIIIILIGARCTFTLSTSADGKTSRRQTQAEASAAS